MGYRLQMSAEIRDWLADLRDTDPPAALLAGQALAALAEEGEGLGPPLVCPASRPGPEDLRWALDRHYQALLESLTGLRRRVADAATLRRDIEQQIAELQFQPADHADHAGQLAELRRLLTGVTEAEERLTVTSQREQARADAFRTRKEVLKAVHTAARAEYLIEEAAGQHTGDDGMEPAELSALTAGASGRLRDVTAEIERELGHQAPAGDLLDLRPGAPGDRGIRILFAVEPPGTALLIAVLEGHDAVRDDYPEAVWLSAEVLQRVRAGQAPEAAAHAFAGTRSFLEEFFPGQADEVMRSAAALIAANRPRPLAGQRTRLGLTQAQVARRMGVRQERVSAIERAEPGATEVRTLASYVEALGGRLDIVADFGRDRIVLR
jgi:DNA-binding XRE family transcriptional regulator